MTLCISIAHPIARHLVNIQYIFREFTTQGPERAGHKLQRPAAGLTLRLKEWDIVRAFWLPPRSRHQKFPGILEKCRAKSRAFWPGIQEQRKEWHLLCRTPGWTRTLRAGSGFNNRKPQNKIKNWWWKPEKCPFCLLCIWGFYAFKTYFDRVTEKYPSGLWITKKREKMQTKTLNE